MDCFQQHAEARMQIQDVHKLKKNVTTMWESHIRPHNVRNHIDPTSFDNKALKYRLSHIKVFLSPMALNFHHFVYGQS